MHPPEASVAPLDSANSGEILPNRLPWQILSETEQGSSSIATARAAVAYARAVERSDRVTSIAVAVTSVIAVFALRLIAAAVPDRGGAHILHHYNKPILDAAVVILTAAYAVISKVVGRRTRQLRAWTNEQVAVAITQRPLDVPTSLLARRRRWLFAPHVSMLFCSLFLAGMIDVDADEAPAHALIVSAVTAVLLAVAALIDHPTWLRREVLRVDADGLTVAVPPGAGSGETHVLIPWSRIRSIAAEADAVVVSTSRHVPTERFSHVRRRPLPPVGPVVQVPGGYRIVLTTTGVRPETVYWVIEDKLALTAGTSVQRRTDPAPPVQASP